jgi:hypothetical protein
MVNKFRAPGKWSCILHRKLRVKEKSKIWATVWTLAWLIWA